MARYRRLLLMLSAAAAGCLLLPKALMAGDAATLRDPFAVPEVARCELLPAERPDWQLQGVVGRAGDYHAWLVAPPATRLRLRAGARLPGTRWQVTEMTALSITLRADNGCPPPLRLALRERNRVQTTDSAADAVVQHADAG